MRISDLIRELFPSKEMVAYLTEHAEQLYKHNILNMVCKAPIDIRRKAEILSELSKDEDIEKEISEELTRLKPQKSDYKSISKYIAENSFAFNCEYVKKAISLLESNPGDVFSVQTVWYDHDDPNGYDESDFHISSSFENALKYIKKEMKLEEVSWNDKEVLFHFEIRKWSLNKKGDYEEIICYEFIDNKVMFFSYADKTEYSRNQFEPDCDLNLITPFRTGDIVTLDCLPYQPEKTVLILENVSNEDCCSLQGLSYNPDDNIFFTGAIKHGSVFCDFYRPEISPLYRIQTATEPPTGQEQLFNEIKAFLNRDTKKGQEMWLWINNMTADKEKRNRKSRNGVTADEIREYIKNETN